MTAFREKDSGDVGLVNGGFYVCEPSVFDVIDDDLTVWEQQPMSRLVERGQLAAFRHNGFWLPMDTLRDKMVLEQLWGAEGTLESVGLTPENRASTISRE